MPFEVMPLVREIYRQSKARGICPPAATRLVKLLYLGDIEWRRRHEGEPLTDLDWRFLHFGPYANELADLLGSPDIELEEISGGKQTKRFTFSDEELDRRELPEEIARIFGRLLEKWGTVDLNQLLDYVYFDTPPMENATRGAALDFSTLMPLKPARTPKFNESRIREIRERIKARVRTLAISKDGIRISVGDASAGMRAWDEEDKQVNLPIGAAVQIRD